MRYDLTLAAADGTESYTLSVPTSWMDVTLQQYIDWQCSSEPDVCALAGITQPQLDRLAWQDAAYLVNLLAFSAQHPDSPVSPDLKDPGSATYGQLLLATQYFEAHPGKPDVWYAPYLYALYRSRVVYGRYDEDKMEQMRAAILLEPVGACFGDVTFIWAAWLLSMRATPPPPKTMPSPKRKSTRQALRNWVSGLGRCLPWTRSVKPSAAPGPNSTSSTPIRS